MIWTSGVFGVNPPSLDSKTPESWYFWSPSLFSSSFVFFPVLAVLFLPGGKVSFFLQAQWWWRWSMCRVAVVGSLHWLSHFFDLAWAQGSGSGPRAVVEAKNITLAAGSTAVLPCRSPRMVWTSDRLKDRQRVVHWDLVRSSPGYSTERILDMSPGGRQRVYDSINKGRISIQASAFKDGHFSLKIDSETFSFFSRISMTVTPLFIV